MHALEKHDKDGGAGAGIEVGAGENVDGKTDVSLGTSFCVKYTGCKVELSANETIEAMSEAARKAGATVLGSLSKDFQPHGASGLILLAESHMGSHSWPDRGVVVITFYTCGRVDSRPAIIAVGNALKAERIWVVAASYESELSAISDLSFPCEPSSILQPEASMVAEAGASRETF